MSSPTDPVVSVIVPLYGVEQYVEECLQSIVGQEYSNLDLVIVDDASIDSSLRIARAMAPAATTFVELPANVGLGEARNRGINAAVGKVVMFVDGDDLLAPGAIRMVADSYTRERWDMMMFGHDEVRGSDVEPSPHNVDLGDRRITTLEGDRSLLRCFNSAWSKAFDLAFLRASGVKFPPGLYEDIPFSYPLLTRAGAIAVEPSSLYRYRVGRPDSIVNRRSERQFEVFDQVSLALERSVAETEVSSALYDKLVSHLLAVYDAPNRLPTNSRRRFFTQMAEWALERQPPGHRPPGAFFGLRRRLIRSKAFRIEQILSRISHR